MVEKALAMYAIAHDTTLAMPQRVRALGMSLTLFTEVCASGHAYLRYASLSRVAREYGYRVQAVESLSKLYQSVSQAQEVNPSEPFLTTSAHFDQLSPGDAIANWVMCSILEELERSSHFSSFYSGNSARARLEMIRDMKFGSPEMARRLALVDRRFPKV
jgi:hypothetical protein